MKNLLLTVLLIFFPFFPVFSQENQYVLESQQREERPQSIPKDPGSEILSNLAARGKYLTVKIAVAGPGDEIYLWWGHIGIIVEDALSGRSLFYDWGNFSFDTENFYYDFSFGRLYYSCSVSPAENNIKRLKRENRDITLYTLDLSDEAKAELLLFAENNVLPENRDYLYHHFIDNCATRVRDIIDTAVGGAFYDKYGNAPGSFTLRGHVRRHTWFSHFWDWALSFWMGQGIDKPLKVWDEMFLPSEIARRCNDFVYADNAGVIRKLVSKTEVLNRSEGRPVVAAAPPPNCRKELILGFALAFVFGILRLRSAGILPETKRTSPVWFFKTAQGSRYVLGILNAAAGFFFGIMGSLLVFLWFFTTHEYTYNNINLIYVNPLLLAVVPLAITAAFGKNPEKRLNAEHLSACLWTIVFLGGIVTIILRVFPAFYQQNQPALAFVLPQAFALSVLPSLFFRLYKRMNLPAA